MAMPQTRGDQRENHAQDAADAVAAIVGPAELLLIATVAALAHKIAVGVMPVAVAQRRLKQVAGALFDRAAPQIRAVLDEAQATAAAGVRQIMATDLGHETALSIGRPNLSQLVQSLDHALDTATATLQDNLSAAQRAADAVQGAIGSTRGGAPYSSLSLSRIQAAQKALDGLGEQGITGYTDRAGRRWNLVSYVEMATRTAISNAWDDLQADTMARSGLDLVTVSTHSTEGSCRHCLPWLGRTLSLTGATRDVPTLEDATAAGFRHPNCRCFWTPVGAGVMADVTNPVPLERAAAVYKASQRQRALERQVRDAGRRATAAITPAARAKARRDLAVARAASEAHRRKTGLRMTQASVRRREHPHRAH